MPKSSNLQIAKKLSGQAVSQEDQLKSICNVLLYLLINSSSLIVGKIKI